MGSKIFTSYVCEKDCYGTIIIVKGSGRLQELLLQEIVSRINGQIITKAYDISIKNVVNKSQKINSNNTLYFNIRAKEKINLDKFEKYKEIVIVTDKKYRFKELGDKVILVIVRDINEAYFKFANYYRSLFEISLIGITGTCGKTTTKEMITYILKKDFNVCSTYKSNNSLALNLDYLTSINSKTDLAVIEMGVAYPNDMQKSCLFFKPNIGVLLNLGVYHLQGFNNPEEYWEEKVKLLKYIDKTGTIILNNDDENIRKIDIKKLKGRIIYFGIKNYADFVATNIKYVDGGMQFTLKHLNKAYNAFVPGYGEHNVYNALAAIASTYVLGISIEESISTLASFEQLIEHIEIKKGINGSVVIDDTWNSSPLSMKAALRVLNDYSNGMKLAILGDMPQLGSNKYSEKQYRMLGKSVVKAKIDFLIIVGNNCKSIAIAAIDFGFDKNRIFYSDNGQKIYNIIKPRINKNTTVLLKIAHRTMMQPSFVKLMDNLIIK